MVLEVGVCLFAPPGLKPMTGLFSCQSIDAPGRCRPLSKASGACSLSEAPALPYARAPLRRKHAGLCRSPRSRLIALECHDQSLSIQNGRIEIPFASTFNSACHLYYGTGHTVPAT